MKILLAILLSALLTACGTTDSQLTQQGRSPGYIAGFHDGRHSGIAEAGNPYEHFIKDTQRFDTDAEYREGWLAGEAEGKRLQEQSAAAGAAAAGAYGAHQIDKEIDKATDYDKMAKDAVKGVDTDGLDKLGQ